jgi:hypothetical protein
MCANRRPAHFLTSKVAPRELRFRWHRVAYLTGGLPMLDVIMLAIGLVSFAASIAYVYACDRL